MSLNKSNVGQKVNEATTDSGADVDVSEHLDGVPASLWMLAGENGQTAVPG